MHIDEVRILLEERMGHKVADGFFADCVDAFFKGHVGPAALGSHAVLGLYTPFEHVLGHELKYPGHPCWPCSEAISLGAFFHQRNGLGEIIRECLRDFRNRTAPLPVRIGVFIRYAYGKDFEPGEDWGLAWYARMARRLLDSGMSEDGVIATMREHRVPPAMVRRYGRSTGLRPETVADNILRRPPRAL